MKKSIAAFAAYLLPTFPLGYFWHLVTFSEQYERLNIFRPDVVIPLGLATMIVQAGIFAWVYPRLFSTAKGDWVGSALRFGGLFGLLAWSFAVVPVAAKYRMTSVSDFLMLESAFTAIQFAVVSPLIALAHRDRV